MKPAKELESTFPAEEILSVIQNAFADKSEVHAILNKESGIHSSKIVPIHTQPHINSLAFVELLVDLEPLVRCKLPVTVVKAGGYETIEELNDDILPKLEDLWKNLGRN